MTITIVSTRSCNSSRFMLPRCGLLRPVAIRDRAARSESYPQHDSHSAPIADRSVFVHAGSG